jgi:hypothetical protein
MTVRLSASRTGSALLPQNIFFIPVTGTHFCWRLTKPQGLERPEGLGKLIQFNYLITTRTRGLLACSIVPQPLQVAMPLFLNVL